MKLRCSAERCQFKTQRDSLIRDDTKRWDDLIRYLEKKPSLDFLIRSLRIAEKSGKLQFLTPTELKLEGVGAVNSDNDKRIREAKGYNGGYRDQQQRLKGDSCGKNHLESQTSCI